MNRGQWDPVPVRDAEWHTAHVRISMHINALSPKARNVGSTNRKGRSSVVRKMALSGPFFITTSSSRVRKGAKPAVEDPAIRNAARALGIDVSVFEYTRPDEIAAAFERLGDRAQALYIAPDPIAMIVRREANALALARRLPTIFAYRDHVEAGGLVSYGPNVAANFRRAAELVDKILRGAKPGDIPVEQPTKYELVINLKTAKAIGLEVSPLLLARADEVIE
jgi:hypothetical protein